VDFSVCGGDFTGCATKTVTIGGSSCNGNNNPSCVSDANTWTTFVSRGGTSGSAINAWYDGLTQYGQTVAATNVDFTAGAIPGQSTSVSAAGSIANFDVDFASPPSIFVKTQSPGDTKGAIQKMDSSLALQTTITPCAQDTATSIDHALTTQLAYTTDNQVMVMCREVKSTTPSGCTAPPGYLDRMLRFSSSLALVDKRVFFDTPDDCTDLSPASAAYTFFDAGTARNVAWKAGTTAANVGNYITVTGSTQTISQASITYSATIANVNVDKINQIRWVAYDTTLKAFAADSGGTLLTQSLSYTPTHIESHGNTIYISHNSPNQISKYTLSGSTLTLAATLSPSCANMGVFGISPDGKYLYVPCSDLAGGYFVRSFWAPTLAESTTYYGAGGVVQEMQADIANNYLYGYVGSTMVKWETFPYTNSTGGDGANGAVNPPPAAGTTPVAGDPGTIPGFTGGSSGGTVSGSNLIANAKTGVEGVLGIDATIGGWIFGIGLVVTLVVAISRRTKPTPTIVGVAAFMGVGGGTALGWFPQWFLFVIVFVVLAVAGHQLFEKKGGGGDD
jgi:hypothetical protein